MRLIKERLRNYYESVKGKSCYGCVKAGLGPRKYIYWLASWKASWKATKCELEKASWKASWKRSSWKFNI